MIRLLKNMLGIGPKANMGDLIHNGALILDVRSKGEYSRGHIKGSVNVPLDQLPGYIKTIKDKNRPIITCCASGMRSASAKNLLEQQGYTNVHNAGSWSSLKTHEE